jgi:hypothetical protein
MAQIETLPFGTENKSVNVLDSEGPAFLTWYVLQHKTEPQTEAGYVQITLLCKNKQRNTTND